MSLWRMILTNLRRRRVRTAIGATGIALGVATMLSVVGLLGGAVKMFERILRSDAQMVVFEKNVSDLFFSNVPVAVAEDLKAQPCVRDAQPGFSRSRWATALNWDKAPTRWQGWCGWRTALRMAGCSCRWVPARRPSTRMVCVRW